MQSLDAARRLAEAGVPIFLARHSPNNLGFALPSGWEKTQADPSVVDRWKPGMALCAVMGHAVDAIDIDPRNGGSLDALRDALGGTLPTVYGVQATPSGGQHLLIAPLGVRKAQNVVPGVDVQAGKPDGVGRGFIFLAPTVRDSKATGKSSGYTWTQEPDLDLLLLGDDSGEGLRSLVEAHHGRVRGKVNSEGSYDGPIFSELTEAQKAEAEEVVASNIAQWRDLLNEAQDWPEGQQDGRGRGWEALAYQSAWALAKMAACPWMGIDEVEAALLYDELLPPAIAENEQCAGKWFDGIVEKAEGEPVDVPPWVERGDVEDDFGVVRRPSCDVSNEAHASTWLDEEVGRRGLAGVFRRKTDLVYTPRVGEDGYKPPRNVLDYDGPSQVRRLDSMGFANRIDASYRVFKVVGKNKVPQDALFPEHVARRALSDLDEMPNLQHLNMVSHTPIVRADGTILDTPGYDPDTGVLYLPERGLTVDPVPELPTVDDVAAATKLLLSMVQDFPFVTVHDRANYLGCLLVPLIRALVPPPYKMLILGAPQRGSGKSLLALIIRIIHGGVFRSEIPREEEERRKVITSILDSTSAPVVQFDNVAGGLKSPTFDGLLTSPVWSDRRLGGNVNVELPNDRLWVVTGNNVHIGGDLDRRVLWSTINANMEQPELRPSTAFHIPDLEGWVHGNRGDLIRALLTLVRAWAVAGMPVKAAPTSDSFGRMTQVLQGVLDHAGIPGVIGDQTSKPAQPDLEAEEWARFLKAARSAMGDKPWTTRDLIDMVGDGFDEDSLPGDLADRVRHQSAGVVKSLGKLLSARRGQWCGGHKAEGTGGGRTAVKWRVDTLADLEPELI